MAQIFDPALQESLTQLLTWRRDVRHFETRAVSDSLLATLMDEACLAPSVGNSQPWRYVHVQSAEARAQVLHIFEHASRSATEIYDEQKRRLYESLKLEGLREAPLQLAVFCDMGTLQGHGLGRQTMEETLCYSVVCSIHTLWLAAKARGLGLGWVSILEPSAVTKALAVPEDWRFVAYLCLGYPAFETTVPELEQEGWQSRMDACRKLEVR